MKEHRRKDCGTPEEKCPVCAAIDKGVSYVKMRGKMYNVSQACDYCPCYAQKERSKA